jgi:hypothetical protein
MDYGREIAGAIVVIAALYGFLFIKKRPKN